MHDIVIHVFLTGHVLSTLALYGGLCLGQHEEGAVHMVKDITTPTALYPTIVCWTFVKPRGTC